MARALIALWVVMFAVTPALAQTPPRLTIRVGVATDSSPLAGAMVRLLLRADVVRTTASGLAQLRLDSLPVQLVISRLGFSPETVTVASTAAPLLVLLQQAALALVTAEVQSDQAFTTAGSRRVRELDLHIRPRESAQDLLRLAPGLVIAQHAGGGKAEQLYLRGFDADHGTDVAVSVDDIPVNMVTHAHGQGYADLHWLMPEVVERVDVRKGPFDARDGDFATAGAVTFRTKDRLEEGMAVHARTGSFGSRHVVGLVPVEVSRSVGYFAASAHSTDGPFLEPQDYRRWNAFGKMTVAVADDAELLTTASAFAGRWNASGQLPDRAVRSGLISRFGSLDPTEGGTTSRYDLATVLRSRGAGATHWEARVFATRYDFDLFSNFTFFLLDSVNGDGIEQRDARTMLGGAAFVGRRTTLAGRDAEWTVGVGTRLDAGSVELRHQRERAVLGERVHALNDQRHLYHWSSYQLELTPRLRLDAGARADLFRFAIVDRTDGRAARSPTRWDAIVSPKANLAFDVSDATQFFMSVGAGFHSNDARQAVTTAAAESVLPRAISAESGVRHSWNGGTMGVALWSLDLESETVYIGDEGTTLASGGTRRLGADLEVRQQILPVLWADADVNLARGRFRDAPRGADRIPLAPTRTASLGLTLRDGGPLDGGLRIRHISARPATEDNAVRARGYAVTELFASRRWKRSRFTIGVDNLFDVAWNEAQFATTSRLRGEPAPTTELHYTPGAPRNIQIGLQQRF